jgi:hypothetical protein
VGTPYAYLGWTGEGPPYTGVGLRVAIVKPVFSATAYSGVLGGSPSFYEFYNKHGNDPTTENITTDLDLLNVSVVDGWGWSNDLGRYITSMVGDYGLGTIAAQSFTILSDIDVTEGGLFNQTGSIRFDVVVLGFTEYVTAQEYHDYQRFVASGGRLVMMDASSFVAEVKYYPQTNQLALVRGHGWGFDGRKVWRDVFYRWQDANANWVGSNQCCTTHYFRVPCGAWWVATREYNGANITGDYPISSALKQRFGSVVFRCYMGHEENSVTNMTGTTILARWLGPSLSPQNIIAAYLHRYINGTVVDIGVMSSDVVDQDASVQFFLLSSIVDSTRTQSQLGLVL